MKVVIDLLASIYKLIQFTISESMCFKIMNKMHSINPSTGIVTPYLVYIN